MRKPTMIFRNPSNTNAYYWGGKIISCYETTLPCSLDPYTLKTIGKETFGGVLDQGTYGAHFRIDVSKNVLIGFSLRTTIDKQP